jgi:hypothetical protein
VGAEAAAQVLKHLPSKCEVLSSNPCTVKTNKNRTEQKLKGLHELMALKNNLFLPPAPLSWKGSVMGLMMGFLATERFSHNAFL